MADENFEPKVSVIIPMYNVEEFIGECLDCLLIQTLQDFEVWVVDDCSTDGSRRVVEEYLPKFDGRLHILATEKNSGGCAVPRNVGQKSARGKYLFFLDGDDLIIKTGLQELCELAERYNADVVQCEKFYTSDTPDLHGAELKVQSLKQGNFVTEPFVDTDDVRRRIANLHGDRYVWTAWSKLYRRGFFTENNLEYPEIFNLEDLVFTIECLTCANVYLRVPNIINIYRYRPGSILRSRDTPVEFVQKWVSSFITAYNWCDKFLRGVKFFQENPEIRYVALDKIAQDVFRRLVVIYKQFPAAELDEIIRAEFAKAGDVSGVAAFLFSMSNLYSHQIGTYLLNKN